MAASTMGVAGLAVLIIILGLVFQPAILLFLVVLALVPLMIKLGGAFFKHAAPSANTGDGPAVPSTRDASYDPGGGDAR
jgi:1,4-dihydroxy-2-naphthoate octaprenyltransferase